MGNRMGRWLGWLLLNVLVLAVVGLSRSNVWVAGGSDALVSIYRVPLPGLLIGLGMFVLITSLMRPPTGTAGVPGASAAGGRSPARAIMLGILAVLPLGLSLRSLSLGAKNDAVELAEYLGPVRVRSMQAAGSEARLRADCGPGSLVVESAPGVTERVWLGIGPWKIDAGVCGHPLLEPLSQGR